MISIQETKNGKTEVVSDDARKIIIDARGKKLGRLASEAAHLLMGKHLPSFRRHIEGGVKVAVNNAAKLDISAKKRLEKNYARYSGYPGGLRYEPLEEAIKKKGYGEIIRRAVYGMIPANKLRKIRMKNLVIKE